MIKIIKEIKNALRVLEIMDKAGCDIKEVSNVPNNDNFWQIKPKWYVTKKEAEDLQNIILFKENYWDNSWRNK